MQPRKQHLVDTALTLFNENGYHATGIDLILAQSGVSKATLYKHFRSKEELILAALQQRHEQVINNLHNTINKANQSGHCSILAIFDGLDEWFNSEAFFGCNFINASAEYNDPNNPITLYSIKHKRIIVELIREQLLLKVPNEREFKEKKALKDIDHIADKIGLLTEGAIVMAHTQGIKKSALIAKEMAEVILENSYHIKSANNRKAYSND